MVLLLLFTPTITSTQAGISLIDACFLTYGSSDVRCLTASLPGACTVNLEKSARVLPVSPCGTIAVLQVSTQIDVR